MDLTKLRPTELLQLVNSTHDFGTVLTDKRLTRFRNEAGWRIGDGSTIDLFKLAGLLVRDWKDTPEAKAAKGYVGKKADAAQTSRDAVAAQNDIGKMPKVKNPPRKLRCKKSFRLFCQSYFPATFPLKWSADHLRVIDRIEDAVTGGGLFALAMPRGNGKTSLAIAAAMWSVLYGRHSYVVLVASDESAAASMLETIKTQLEVNALLAEDFPEVCYPIACLERVHQRKISFEGRPISFKFSAKQMILPDIPGSLSASAILDAVGITGGIRGKLYTRPSDGVAVRPSLVVIDDPQTDESAKSPQQCADRLAVLRGAVLGLAGPGKKISGIMPCTVIRPNDMADQILNRDDNPQWQGIRTKMVYDWPTDEKLWKDYATIRADGMRDGSGTAKATAFYRKHRKAMDAGSRVAWPQRYADDELSAIQHAWNLRLDVGEAAFASEYQNEPLIEKHDDGGQLPAAGIAEKLHGIGRGDVPAGCDELTMFVDVQKTALYWVVVAWSNGFSGFVIDYGTFPDQHRDYFSLTDVRQTLASRAKGAGLEGSIFAGLGSLTGSMLIRDWRRDDGTELRIGRCLVDANWGQSTDVVYQFCRQSLHAAILTPSHGRGIGAKNIPMGDWARKAGDRVGVNWRLTRGLKGRGIRHVTYNTNYWKSFVHTRLSTAMGDKGSLSLFGDEADRHRMFADHLVSEYCVEVKASGRTVGEWQWRPEHADNHWLDCLVGCAVAASMQGVALDAHATQRKAKPQKRLSLAERRAAKR